MLKFIKHNMETITGIEIFPLISFLIFFTFFTGVLIYLWRSDKDRMRRISELPLENDQNSIHEKD